MEPGVNTGCHQGDPVATSSPGITGGALRVRAGSGPQHEVEVMNATPAYPASISS
jgi:hypothetical protein